MVNFLKLDVFGGISSREEGVGEWIAGIRAACSFLKQHNEQPMKHITMASIVGARLVGEL